MVYKIEGWVNEVSVIGSVLRWRPHPVVGSGLKACGSELFCPRSAPFLVLALEALKLSGILYPCQYPPSGKTVTSEVSTPTSTV
jgi:hypothetical protein